MLLMALKDLQAGLQQTLQLGILADGISWVSSAAIDRLVIGDLVGNVGLVVFGALQLAELGELVGGLLR